VPLLDGLDYRNHHPGEHDNGEQAQRLAPPDRR
jgi:hypothetical protein